ncbi:MAG: EI24 domain-containing protein [Epsilonproteobacteria bacterium]|nr:EI24 domain-containing protein [Campylobacterota bacterium]
MNVFDKSIKDFFKMKFLLLSTLPFLLSFFILGAVFLYGGSEFLNMLLNPSSGNGIEQVDPNIHPIISYILTFALVKWVFVTFFYLFGTILIVLISVIIGVIVIGFFTPYIVKNIQEDSYPNYIRSQMELKEVIWLYAKTFLIFIFLIIVCIPLLLFPGVNLFIFHVPFYYLFHNLLLIDIGSNIEDLQRYKMIVEKEKKSFMISTLIFYVLSLIPIVGLFLQVFFVIFLTHLFFEKSIQISQANQG